jgi:hypothetical protein
MCTIRFRRRLANEYRGRGEPAPIYESIDRLRVYPGVALNPENGQDYPFRAAVRKRQRL